VGVFSEHSVYMDLNLEVQASCYQFNGPFLTTSMTAAAGLPLGHLRHTPLHTRWCWGTFT